MDIKFEKWQGLGNDFIILENADATSDLAKKMCDRNFGIGADGLFSAVKFDRHQTPENLSLEIMPLFLTYFAKHLIPLPHICATEPSEL